MSNLPTTLSRGRLTVLSAVVALAGSGIVAANLAAAGSGPSVLDYAQCQNGAPNTSPSPDCNWINGILNASASQYHEDQVTAQRLTISFPDKGSGTHSHSVTLSYLDRKGGIHAYDSLAQVDTTMADADDLRCRGIESICPTGSASLTDVVLDDDDDVGPVASGVDPTVSEHQLTGQKLMLWGATFPNTGAMTNPTHDNNATNSGDDYATTTINFNTDGDGSHVVQLLFGGHLAAGLTASGGGSFRGWGTGLGAADVSGGPYHIKLAAVDGASAGNRDNQIMSNAIIKIVAQGTTVTSTATPNGNVVIGTTSLTTAHDQANVQVASTAHPPTGSAVISLYGPFTTAPTAAGDCVDPATGVTGNRLATFTVTGPWVQEGSTTTYDADIPQANWVDLTATTGFAAGKYYQWTVTYVPGTDQYNQGNTSDCTVAGERIHVTKHAAAATSTQKVTDVVTVTGFGTPTGTVSWYLYPSLPDCQAGTNLTASDVAGSPVSPDTDTNNALSSGSATSKAIPITTATGSDDYFWKVTYDGSNDANNASGVVEDCGTQTVTVQNAPTPTP